jgi:hypothetical protein
MSNVRKDITPEDVRKMIQGKDVHFVHVCLGPALLAFEPKNRVKHPSLRGEKLRPRDTVIIMPSVGKDGRWIKGQASRKRPTKVVKEVVAYSFKVVARRVR